MKSPFDELTIRYPILIGCRSSIEEAYQLLLQSFERGHKLLLCGNGGSACDAEHIVGELMKGFLLSRPLPSYERALLSELAGEDLGASLQRALPAIALTGHIGLSTAVANDNRGDVGFAQQIYGLGQPGDVLMGLSTSGNSENVIHAFHVARLRGVSTVALTGWEGGKLARIADVCVRVPAHQTPQIQELHLPIYHSFCIALEQHFFGAIAS